MSARRTRRISILALAALAQACASVAAQSPGPGDKPDADISSGAAQHALNSAKARWKRAKIHDYDVRVALSCFCAPQVRRARTIKVRGSSPVRPPSALSDVATVGRMFKVIQKAITDGVVSLTATYGPYGVPKVIAIDVSRQIADEERAYNIDRFKKR
jgi:hypothetical protein